MCTWVLPTLINGGICWIDFFPFPATDGGNADGIEEKTDLASSDSLYSFWNGTNGNSNHRAQGPTHAMPGPAGDLNVELSSAERQRAIRVPV